jgi:hypothetical protein
MLGYPGQLSLLNEIQRCSRGGTQKSQLKSAGRRRRLPPPALEDAEETAAEEATAAAAATAATRADRDITDTAAAAAAAMNAVMCAVASDLFHATGRCKAFGIASRDGKGISGDKSCGEHSCASYDQLFHVEPRSKTTTRSMRLPISYYSAANKKCLNFK